MGIRSAFSPMSSVNIDPTPIRFDPTGSLQEYIVPAGCSKILVECVAAKGFGTTGGGGRVACELKVKPKQRLFIYAGSVPVSRETPTYNASDIRTSAEGVTDAASLANRLVVAGAAGNQASRGPIGGPGGDLTGGNGGNGYRSDSGGSGGTQESGGKAGLGQPVGVGHYHNGTDGSFGLGGPGIVCGYEGTTGAGGAGWYGGGSGAGDWNKNGGYTGGGGGGSSYTHPDLCSKVEHTQGYNNGDGYVIITPLKK